MWLKCTLFESQRKKTAGQRIVTIGRVAGKGEFFTEKSYCDTNKSTAVQSAAAVVLMPLLILLRTPQQ